MVWGGAGGGGGFVWGGGGGLGGINWVDRIGLKSNKMASITEEFYYH